MIQQIYPAPAHNFAYELNKDFHFAAAHSIPDADAGKCMYVHGHTYYANITVAGDELNSSGFLVNFKTIKELLHDRFDHGVLNDDQRFSKEDSNLFPTTEVVARVMHEIIQEYLDTTVNKPSCLQIFLRETPTSYVIYRPKNGGMS